MDNKYLKKVMHILHVIIDAFKRLGTALGKPIQSSPKKSTTEAKKGKWFKRGSSIGSTALIVFLGVAAVSMATGGPLIAGDNPSLKDQSINQNVSDNQNQTSQSGNIESSNSQPRSNFQSSSNSQPSSSEPSSTPIQTITTTYDVTTTNLFCTLTANVVDSQGNPVNEGTVDFTVNGISVGSATVQYGKATNGCKLPSLSYGSYLLTANYQGTSSYLASTGSGKLYYTK